MAQHTPPPIVSGPFEVVTKLEAATRQLAMAIELCLLGRDTVSTRTLAAAAHEIFRTLLRRIPGHHGSGLLDNPLADKDMQKRIRVAAGVPRNFFKHADTDPDRVLRYRPSNTEAVIVDAAVMEHDLMGKFSTEGFVFFMYFMTVHAEQFEPGFPPADRAREIRATLGTEVPDKHVFAMMLKHPEMRADLERRLKSSRSSGG